MSFLRRIILIVLSLACIETAQAFPGQTVTETDSSTASSKTRLLYIRHGEVPGNDPHPSTYIYTGSGTNSSLTEKGKAQAEKCAGDITQLQQKGSIGPISAIYASDLRRAQETAKPLAETLGLTVQLRQALREINWGSADGQLVETMTKQYADKEAAVQQQFLERKTKWDYLPVFEGAETYNALLKRSQDALRIIAEKHVGETVIVVGHGRVLKTLIADARDSEEKIPYPANCGIAEFTYSADEGLRFIDVLNNK